jgi:predicted nucleic acid-binding protein
MAQIVIADAGPLIALAKVNLLAVLAELFGNILIPDTVRRECLIKLGEESQRIQQAIATGIIQISTPAQTDLALALSRSLGAGERDAIYLAMQSENALLIMDDLLARKQAVKLGLAFIGTVRLLDIAEKQGIIADAGQVIDAISDTGYRISKAILQQLRAADF